MSGLRSVAEAAVAGIPHSILGGRMHWLPVPLIPPVGTFSP
jgi:hypothetical protein